MVILGRKLIDDYMRKHAGSKAALGSWVTLVRLAKWQTPQDIRNAINSVDFLSGNRVIFNIGGNNFRLVAKVIFVVGQIRVVWIGTHAEYSKQKF